MIFLAVIVALVATGIKTLICCMLFHKAGFSWALGLLILVPIANIVAILYLTFADWPVRRELRQLREQHGLAL